MLNISYGGLQWRPGKPLVPFRGVVMAGYYGGREDTRRPLYPTRNYRRNYNTRVVKGNVLIRGRQDPAEEAPFSRSFSSAVKINLDPRPRIVLRRSFDELQITGRGSEYIDQRHSPSVTYRQTLPGKEK